MLVLGPILGTINLLVLIRIEKSKEKLTFAAINFEEAAISGATPRLRQVWSLFFFLACMTEQLDIKNVS